MQGEHLLDPQERGTGGQALHQRLEPPLDVPDAGDLGDQPLRHPCLDAQPPRVQRAHRLHERGVLPGRGLLAGMAQQLGDRALVLRTAREHGIPEGGGPRTDVQEAPLGGIALQELLGMAGRHGGAAAGVLEHPDQLEQEPARGHRAPESLGVDASESGVVMAHHVPVEQGPHVLRDVQLAVPVQQVGDRRVREVLEAHPARDERVHLRLGEVGDAAAGHHVQVRLLTGGLVGERIPRAVPGGAEGAAPALGQPGLQVERVQPHAAHEHGVRRAHGIQVQLRGQVGTPVVQDVGLPGCLGQTPLGCAEHRVLVAQAQDDGVGRQLLDAGPRPRVPGRAARPQRQARAAVVRRVERDRLGAVHDDVADLRTRPQGGQEGVCRVLEVTAVHGPRRVVLPLEAPRGVGVGAAPVVEGGGDGRGAQPGVVRGAGRGEEGRGVHEQQGVLVRAPYTPGTDPVRVHEVQGPRPRAGLVRLESSQEPVQHHDAPWPDPHDGEGAVSSDGPVHGVPPPGGGSTLECTA